jgi:hypothetical protein
MNWWIVDRAMIEVNNLIVQKNISLDKVEIV